MTSGCLVRTSSACASECFPDTHAVPRETSVITVAVCPARCVRVGDFLSGPAAFLLAGERPGCQPAGIRGSTPQAGALPASRLLHAHPLLGLRAARPPGLQPAHLLLEVREEPRGSNPLTQLCMPTSSIGHGRQAIGEQISPFVGQLTSRINWLCCVSVRSTAWRCSRRWMRGEGDPAPLPPCPAAPQSLHPRCCDVSLKASLWSSSCP